MPHPDHLRKIYRETWISRIIVFFIGFGYWKRNLTKKKIFFNLFVYYFPDFHGFIVAGAGNVFSVGAD